MCSGPGRPCPSPVWRPSCFSCCWPTQIPQPCCSCTNYLCSSCTCYLVSWLYNCVFMFGDGFSKHLKRISRSISRWLPHVCRVSTPGSQMVLADLTEPEQRANALSKIGICFGVGMIAGSTIGGNLNTMYGWVGAGIAEFPYWGHMSLMRMLSSQHETRDIYLWENLRGRAGCLETGGLSVKVLRLLWARRLTTNHSWWSGNWLARQSD